MGNPSSPSNNGTGRERRLLVVGLAVVLVYADLDDDVVLRGEFAVRSLQGLLNVRGTADRRYAEGHLEHVAPDAPEVAFLLQNV